jgi:GNAT superfamily N-acetyltransferase
VTPVQATHGQGATIRPAAKPDIDRLIVIRGVVTENRLRDPASVTRDDYEWFVARGLVWVAERGGQVAGFAAGDPRDASIWAVFVDPAFEGAGLGAVLLGKVCADLRAAGHARAWLVTDPGTKAARLYRRLGWEEHGLSPEGGMRFEILL